MICDNCGASVEECGLDTIDPEGTHHRYARNVTYIAGRYPQVHQWGYCCETKIGKIEVVLAERPE